VVVDSKTQYPVVCNAAESLIVHRKALAPVLPELVLRLGQVPIIRHEGTAGVGESIKPHLADTQAFILANRGVVVVGSDVWDAASRLELVEHYARALFMARLLGKVRGLSDSHVARLVEKRFTEEGGRNL